MKAPFKVTFVISANGVGPRMRPAFNERFDAVTAWLQSHAITKARVVFAIRNEILSFVPLDLVAPADQLSIPTKGVDSALSGLAMALSDTSSPRHRTPHLAVVLSTLIAAETELIEDLVHKDPNEGPLGYYLFVVGQDAAGRSNGAFASSLAERYPHIETVLPGQETQDIYNGLDRLLSLTERNR